MLALIFQVNIKTRSLVNIQNYNDNCCFLWSILAHVYYNETESKHRFRPSNYFKYVNYPICYLPSERNNRFHWF